MAADVEGGDAGAAPAFEERLRGESRAWLAQFVEVVNQAGRRVLDLGCGEHYADAAVLAERGFSVFACDRSLDDRPGPAIHAFVADISEPLPVRTATVDAVLASLSLHYFPWALGGLFTVHHLAHRTIYRYGAPKRVWECLASVVPGSSP